MMLSQIYSWLGIVLISAALLITAYTIWFLGKGKEKQYSKKLQEYNTRKVKVESTINSVSSESEIPATVRDFIYIDGDRLYSFYSQVFQGVAESVVQSYLGSLETKGSTSSGKSESLEAGVAEAVLRTENKVLYDHMYNLLEKKIGTRVVDVEDITIENYLEKIADKSLLRIHGSAEMEDYSRLKEFMSRFNDIADAIAYATIYSNNKLNETLKKTEEDIQSISDPNKRIVAKTKFDVAKDPKKLAKELGLRQDDQLLKNLVLFAELFHKDGFDVTISPTTSGDVVYRGLLNRQWLRVQPEMLRALYGISAKGKWVMVGQPTFIPSMGNESDDTKKARPDIISDENPSMRDSFKNMFDSSKNFETMFQKSKNRIEIIIAPLAIYREIEIESEE